MLDMFDKMAIASLAFSVATLVAVAAMALREIKRDKDRRNDVK